MAVKVQKSGERTIIDPAITYQRIYSKPTFTVGWLA
jgi:hypothetical protein